MATRMYGVLSLRADGEALEIATEWTFDLSAFTRETAMGANGPVGHKFTPVAPYFEGEVFDTPEITFDKLKAIQGVSATLQLRSGKTLWLRDAAQVGELTGEAHEGKYRLRLEGREGGEA